MPRYKGIFLVLICHVIFSEQTLNLCQERGDTEWSNSLVSSTISEYITNMIVTVHDSLHKHSQVIQGMNVLEFLDEPESENGFVWKAYNYQFKGENFNIIW